MAHRSDPVRWLHPDSDVPEELRRVLDSARADGGGPDALHSLAARLPLAAGAKLSAPAAASAAKKAILSWKLAAWVAGTAAVGGAATNLILLAPPSPPAITASVTTSGAAGRPAERASLDNAALAAPGADTGEETAPAPANTALSQTGSHPGHAAPQPPRSAAPRATAPQDVPSAAAPAEAGPDSLGAEAKLLLQARADMARDPHKALRETETHGAAFADGTLSEEREVLRIEALMRLGKYDDAARAAAAFRAAHPQSSHLARVDRLLRAPR